MLGFTPGNAIALTTRVVLWVVATTTGVVTTTTLAVVTSILVVVATIIPVVATMALQVNMVEATETIDLATQSGDREVLSVRGKIHKAGLVLVRTILSIVVVMANMR